MINFLTLARKLNFLTSNEVSTAYISNRYGEKTVFLQYALFCIIIKSELLLARLNEFQSINQRKWSSKNRLVITSGGSSGVAGWAVPTQNQMTYFF
jgi:hypothetical protein